MNLVKPEFVTLRATKVTCPNCKEVFYSSAEEVSDQWEPMKNRGNSAVSFKATDPSVQRVSGMDFYKALDEATSVK